MPITLTEAVVMDADEWETFKQAYRNAIDRKDFYFQVNGNQFNVRYAWELIAHYAEYEDEVKEANSSFVAEHNMVSDVERNDQGTEGFEHSIYE